MATYYINLTGGDLLVIMAGVFFIGFTVSIWVRYFLFKLDMRLTALYLSIWWSMEFDWQKYCSQLKKIGLTFPLWEGITI